MFRQSLIRVITDKTVRQTLPSVNCLKSFNKFAITKDFCNWLKIGFDRKMPSFSMRQRVVYLLLRWWYQLVNNWCFTDGKIQQNCQHTNNAIYVQIMSYPPNGIFNCAYWGGFITTFIIMCCKKLGTDYRQPRVITRSTKKITYHANQKKTRNKQISWKIRTSI